MYLDASQPPHTKPTGYPFHGFFIPYPSDEKPLGLVSMISDDPPAMGWIYADEKTLEIKYGNRSTSIDHFVGPFDWTKDEKGITLEEEEGFVAVEEESGVWAVYYDRYGGFEDLPVGKRKLEISLEREMVEIMRPM